MNYWEVVKPIPPWLHTSTVLQQAISYNMARGSSISVAFLDIPKGVWHRIRTEITIQVVSKWPQYHDIAADKRLCYSWFELVALVSRKLGPWFEPERAVNASIPNLCKQFTEIISIAKSPTDNTQTGFISYSWGLSKKSYIAYRKMVFICPIVVSQAHAYSYQSDVFWAFI